MMFKRLQYDIKDIQKYPQFSLDFDELDNKIIYISFKGDNNTLYEKEIFKLKFQFNEGYVNKNFYNIIIFIIFIAF